MWGLTFAITKVFEMHTDIKTVVASAKGYSDERMLVHLTANS